MSDVQLQVSAQKIPGDFFVSNDGLLRTNFHKANSLPSELAGPGLKHVIIVLKLSQQDLSNVFLTSNNNIIDSS